MEAQHPARACPRQRQNQKDVCLHPLLAVRKGRPSHLSWARVFSASIPLSVAMARDWHFFLGQIDVSIRPAAAFLPVRIPLMQAPRWRSTMMRASAFSLSSPTFGPAFQLLQPEGVGGATVIARDFGSPLANQCGEVFIGQTSKNICTIFSAALASVG